MFIAHGYGSVGSIIIGIRNSSLVALLQLILFYRATGINYKLYSDTMNVCIPNPHTHTRVVCVCVCVCYRSKVKVFSLQLYTATTENGGSHCHDNSHDNLPTFQYVQADTT